MQRPTYPPECGELRPIGAIAAKMVADLQFRCRIERLHRLGDRVIGAFLAELGAVAAAFAALALRALEWWAS